jgi:hypothetical protein
MFKIEKKVPIPARTTTQKYPFRDMEVGDSFVATDGGKSVLVAASAFTRRNPEYRFTTRKEGDGIRIWRIAK